MEKVNDSIEPPKKRAVIEVWPNEGIIKDEGGLDEQIMESLGYRVASNLVYRLEDAVYNESVNPSYLIDPDGLDKYFDHGSAEYRTLKDKFISADHVMVNIRFTGLANGQKAFETKILFYKDSGNEKEQKAPFYELEVKIDEDGKVVGSIISSIR